MSKGNEGSNYKDQAKKAYAYYRNHGLFGIIGNSWRWLMGDSDRLTALSTFAIFLATAVAVGVGIAQWRVLRGQLAEMKATGEQTDQLIAANNTLAAAAKTSAEAAKRSADLAEAGTRAWIAPVRFTFVDLKDPKEPLKTRVLYQNVGREPATKVRNWLGLGYLRQPPLPPAQWGNLPEWQNARYRPEEMCKLIQTTKTSVVYPTPTLGFSLDIAKGTDPAIPDEYLPQFFAEVKDRTTMFYVTGCISYETLNRVRYSTFCAFLNPGGGGSDISEWLFSACPVGNDDR